MTLKVRVKDIAEVPEALRDHYTSDNGEFVLAVDGMVPNERLREFRDNNISLKQQMDELRTKYDGIDPEEARKSLERVRKERDKELVDAGKFEELVAERLNAIKSGHEKEIKTFAGQVKAANDEKDSLSRQLAGLVIDGAIRDAASKAGVRLAAIEDVLLRGRSLFKLQDGKAVPMDGERPIYGKSGDPMEISEWMSGLAEKAPHLFESSQGGGAGGSGRRAAPNTVSRSDSAAFLANLADIASGKKKVV
jgi:hypothetical protein